MRRKVLFLDVACPKQYDFATLSTSGLGGTEATAVRVAEELARRGHDVTLSQHNRASSIKSPNNLAYEGPYGKLRTNKYDTVLLLRDPHYLPRVQGAWPDAKLYLWMHDLPGDGLRACQAEIQVTRPHILGVSDFHKSAIVDKLQAFSTVPMPRVSFVYNPVVVPENLISVKDKNKLVFFSSPHKGLHHTLFHFRHLRRFNPDFKLYVANPGYCNDFMLDDQENVVNLGVLSQEKALEHVASALCVFYPNPIFPETFGLVLAEANAVGTPVVAHQFGAAHEVLSQYPQQVVDCRFVKPVIDTVMGWYDNGHPALKLDERFKLENVVNEWEKLLCH